MWTDSHCHVHDGPDPAAELARAKQAGVGQVVCVGTTAEDSASAVSVALGSRSPGFDGSVAFATVGLHPHEAWRGAATLVPVLAGSAGAGVVVGVGECGLDYHYDHSPRDVQREAFASQVALAREHGLTLVIHTREAWDDTFAVLAATGVPKRVIFHCFTGGPAEAERCLEIGAWLSFSGIVTFKNADDVRAAAAVCPLERVLVETDSPYLAPLPHRGRRNEPGYVPLVGAGVASVKGLPVEEVEAATTANAAAVFGLDAGGRGAGAGAAGGAG
jgi:TatD DNase family protein